jgi:magnesium chelatase family protein
LTKQELIQPQERIEAESALGSATTDFREIRVQEHVKRALEIAAAGGQNVMTLGTILI